MFFISKTMQFISDVILYIITIFAYIILTPINYFYVKERSRYPRNTALETDKYLNYLYAPMWNSTLIIKGGYRFGNKEESVSEVLGQNILRNTLSKRGKLLVRILTEEHCLDALNKT